MPEQREENSVLFSLKELRRMEDDRLKQEQDERRAKEEAARRAKEDAERRAREEVDRKRHEEEDRVRRIEEERLAREREAQLRLTEAERRARVEGEMRIQEERMRLEMQSKKQARAPLLPIFGVIGLLVLVGGGVAYKVNANHQAELAAKEAERIRMEDEWRRKEQEQQAAFNQKFGAMTKQLEAAKTAEDRNRIAQEMEKERQREVGRRAAAAKARSSGRDTGSGAARPTSPSTKPKGPKSDDPLDGLKL